MSDDQFVSLPPELLAGSQKFEIINILGTIARFALPGASTGNATERDLEGRFSGVPAIGMPDALGWLSQAGVKLQPLDAQLAALNSGDPEPLRQTLQAGNDTQQLQLLAINDASKLVEMEDAGEDSLTPRPLWSKPESCILLRLGYNMAMPFAYYAASLPGDSRRPAKIDWQSVVTAGISGAVAILPPAKTVEVDSFTEDLHIMEQALVAAAAAYSNIRAKFGQQPAPATPLTEQAV